MLTAGMPFFAKFRFENNKVYLTNRFHAAVRLFSNRSQMTSKCGENKKVAHEAIAECENDVEICVPCGWRFLNHFDIVSETPRSCNKVGCEL